jgi:hypothetical protein
MTDRFGQFREFFVSRGAFEPQQVGLRTRLVRRAAQSVLIGLFFHNDFVE